MSTRWASSNSRAQRLFDVPEPPSTAAEPAPAGLATAAAGLATPAATAAAAASARRIFLCMKAPPPTRKRPRSDASLGSSAGTVKVQNRAALTGPVSVRSTLLHGVKQL